MPLLELKELESLSSLFRGSCGNAFGKFLMRVLAIDRINDLYDRNFAHKGPDFAGAVLKDIGMDYQVLNSEVLQKLPEGAFITISNHPYGSLDGIILIDLFGRIRADFKIAINDVLSRVKTLEENFICVTPIGNEVSNPTKDTLRGIKEGIRHIKNGHPLGLFPSGAVSDLSLKERRIRDRRWQKPVIRLIKRAGVPIVPVHFLDRNSNFYYSLGLIDWRIRLLRLPYEVFNKRGMTARVALGEIITPEEQKKYKDVDDFGDFLRAKVYNQY
ncbi:MAG TPA: 1-acyl-sn-glycerol-3-phosphate acyltransferase [Bacteroidaceae bacterium]|nr:1-acyl-sn-glycerol-3-phosphate acyltransferase [Bacteroidaceae bacterium]